MKTTSDLPFRAQTELKMNRKRQKIPVLDSSAIWLQRGITKKSLAAIETAIETEQ